MELAWLRVADAAAAATAAATVDMDKYVTNAGVAARLKLEQVGAWQEHEQLGQS